MDLLHHSAVKLTAWLVDAGCVDHDDLRGRLRLARFAPQLCRNFKHAQDACARGLRFVRYDCELFAQQCIQQCGLAGIRPADDRDESRAKGHSCSVCRLIFLTGSKPRLPACISLLRREGEVYGNG